MEVDCLPFSKTGYFSRLICDYLDEKETLKPFYHRFPNLENFKDQLTEKRKSFPLENRLLLSRVLGKQYQNTPISKSTRENISLLASENTFTVVTGHQLNLFTGPLYFLYKIISTINLTKELKKAYPQYEFVPIYWMATEDHDFEEINYFNLHGKKLQWSKKVSGAVGHLDTEGLEPIFNAFVAEIGSSKNGLALQELFYKTYLEHTNLAEATHFLANSLFGEYGLVVLNSDDRELKTLLASYVEKDLLQNTAFSEVSATIGKLAELDAGYGVQVNPREINYFYLKNGIRERIVAHNGGYFVNGTETKFTKEAILKELEEYPERFSPNVICRPLYQEVILPNLCYIGGGGEIAYWLLLKSFFDAVAVPFPILLLRNSALVINEKQQKKLSRLNLEIADLFLKQNRLINKKVREISDIDIDLSDQKKHIREQFDGLYGLAAQTDKSFIGAVKAQEVKQLRGLESLEKRLLKAQKRKLEDHVLRLTEIQNELFPNQSLQERNLNFSELYLDFGAELIPSLFSALQPLKQGFSIVKF